MKRLRQFSLFFLAQFFNYAMLTWNYRAIAYGWIASIILTDMLISAYQFKIIKKIVDEGSNAALMGYATGGACGTLLSVWVTRRLFGQ